MPSIAGLFLAFLRLGATAFGGPSIIVYIRRLAVEKRRWLSEGAFAEGVALCQILPGATAMQTAAYVGFKIRGLTGGMATFIGFCLPSFVLMMAFSALYVRTHNLSTVISAFSGLQAIVVAIITSAFVSFGRTTIRNWKGVVISLVSAAMFGWKINPILAIVCAMILGIALRIDTEALQSSVESSFRRSNTGLVVFLCVAAAGYVLLFLFRRPLFDLASMMSVINLFSFGGGFACIPLMLHEVVDVRHWLDSPTFLNGIVLGQVTPGPIMITATFIGYMSHGPMGGVVATIAIFLPAFFLVIWTAPYFKRLLASSPFRAAAGGTLCSFVGLLVAVGVRLALDVHWDPIRAFLACGSLIALLWGADILWVVLFGTALSVILL